MCERVCVWLSSAVFTHLCMIKCMCVYVCLCAEFGFCPKNFQVSFNVVFGFDVFIFNFGRNISLYTSMKYIYIHIDFDFVSIYPHEIKKKKNAKFIFCYDSMLCTLYSCKSMPLHSHEWMVACFGQFSFYQKPFTKRKRKKKSKRNHHHHHNHHFSVPLP